MEGEVLPGMRKEGEVGMTKAEQEWSLIEALEHCKKKRPFNKSCAGCPYAGFGCGIDAAIEKLKAQEPRVMMREEYGEWCKLPDFERKPVVIENMRTNSLVWCWWAAVAPGHDMTVYRIWTAWPTDEQREAIPWE